MKKKKTANEKDIVLDLRVDKQPSEPTPSAPTQATNQTPASNGKTAARSTKETASTQVESNQTEPTQFEPNQTEPNQAEPNQAGEPNQAEVSMVPTTFWRLVLAKIKVFARFVFIDGLSGMTLGLFATLIIGTIIAQLGKYIGDNFVGNTLSMIGTVAKLAMGAGIGVGLACKFKKPPLVMVSAAVTGLVGAHATALKTIIFEGGTFSVGGAGEPVGAFVAAMFAVGIGGLVSGKTKVDIIVTPLVAIIVGAVFGLLAGPPISAGMEAIGSAISWAMDQNKIIMGIIIAVLMGMALTLPISSAALGVGLKLSGLAAGVATVGCCCQMIGFAVSSFRENRWGGLVSQGIGTSMLQMPNIVKKPLIWLPPIVASIILGPISALMGMQNNAIGSGMGTAGLVGPLMAFEEMTSLGTQGWQAFLQISLMHFLLPAIICLALSELMRKLKWIKKDDMKL